MTTTMTAIEAHNKGLCWPPECDHCPPPGWPHTVTCDGCGEPSYVHSCDHGRSLCDDCISGFAPCGDCVREAVDE